MWMWFPLRNRVSFRVFQLNLDLKSSTENYILLFLWYQIMIFNDIQYNRYECSCNSVLHGITSSNCSDETINMKLKLIHLLTTKLGILTHTWHYTVIKGFTNTIITIPENTLNIAWRLSSEISKSSRIVGNFIFPKWIRQICQIVLKCLSFYTKYLKLSSKCSQCRSKAFQNEIRF